MSAIFERDEKGRIKKGGSIGGKNQTSFKPGQLATENLQPDKVAELIVSMAENPGESVMALARACGMNEGTANEIVNRLNMKYQPVIEEVGRVTSDSLVRLIEQKLPMLLSGITESKVADARLNEIGVLFGILTEKRQLLNGEPTHIFTHQERQNMNALIPEMMREAKKRGMVVDATYQEIPEITVIPPDVPHLEGLSKTAAAKARKENRAKAR